MQQPLRPHRAAVLPSTLLALVIAGVTALPEAYAQCNADADCTSGYWCKVSTHTCTLKLANGTAMPSDPPHTGPVLNGICTFAAGALVCQSGVCDVADDRCGYANGDGPCSLVTGAI